MRQSRKDNPPAVFARRQIKPFGVDADGPPAAMAMAAMRRSQPPQQIRPFAIESAEDRGFGGEEILRAVQRREERRAGVIGGFGETAVEMGGGDLSRQKEKSAKSA